MGKSAANPCCIATYVSETLAKRIDETRSDIPRSRILERAIIRYLDDVKSGEVSLLPEVRKEREALPPIEEQHQK